MSTHPYSDFITFNFSNIIERLKDKSIKVNIDDGHLIDIYLSETKGYPIAVKYKVPISSSIITHETKTQLFTIDAFQKFLDENKQPEYIVYFIIPCNNVVHFYKYQWGESLETILYRLRDYKILHVIKKNSDGSEELVKF